MSEEVRIDMLEKRMDREEESRREQFSNIWEKLDEIQHILQNRLPFIPTVIASLAMTGMGTVIGWLAKWVEVLIN